MIDATHEKRTRRAFVLAFTLCLCAVLPLVLSLIGGLRPTAETPGQWFERSGAVTTVFAVFAQFKAGSVAAMIQGGTFGESWDMYRKYHRRQSFVGALSIVLAVVGTIVWDTATYCSPTYKRAAP